MKFIRGDNNRSGTAFPPPYPKVLLNGSVSSLENPSRNESTRDF